MESIDQVEKIRAINHHLRYAIDQVGEGVVIVEAEATHSLGPRIVFANRAAGVLCGYAPDDIISQPIGLLYEPESLDALLVRLPAVAKTGKTYQMQKQCVCRGGNRKAFRWTIRGVRDSAGRTVNFVVTFRPANIESTNGAHRPGTEGIKLSGSRMGAGEDLETDEERSIEQSLEKSRLESMALLAGGIAHDFNNVLTTIISNLSLAKLETPPGVPVRNHIEDAIEASQNAQSLAQQILDFTKGRTSTIQTVDPSRLIRQVARLSTMGSRVRCDVHASDEIWGIEVDLRQIRQVLHNLMINACQAMDQGGVIQASVENILVDESMNLGLRPGPYVVLSVRDRGCGIAEENLEKIFEPYFTTKEDGTGLGLATCRTIVQRHGGSITVHSKVNVGTVFRVYLPACPVDEQFRQEPPKSDPSVIGGDGCILVVDDQDSVRLAAERMLEKLGYQTVSAADGQQAINLYRQKTHTSEPVSAVLLDMTLPGGLCGDEVMEEIRKIDPNARIIATSGWFDEDAEERFLLDGYAGILPKPYAVEKLSQKLHESMRRELTSS